MLKNKRLIALVAVMLSLLLVFCACDLSGLFNTGNTDPKAVTIDISQTIGDSYDEVTASNFASVVANIGMPATYEIICDISYTYKRQSFPGGSTTQSGSMVSQATGFAINEDGYLLTNAHVVCVDLSEISTTATNLSYTKRNVYVNLADSETLFLCNIVAYDQTMDLCLLKIKPAGNTYSVTFTDSSVSFDITGSYTQLSDNLPCVTFFNHTDPSDETIAQSNRTSLYYGEHVVAIGNAYGYGIAVTVGVISAPFRAFIWDGDYQYTMKSIQTDAAINSGNSGGPLFNAYGAVIGVTSFKLADESSDNMGYAIAGYIALGWIDSLADGTFLESFTKTATASTGAEANFSGKLNVQYYYTTARAYSNTGEYTFSKL